MASWVVAGAALGLVFSGLAAGRGRAGERRVLAAGLVVAALVYVVLALGSGDAARVALELGGAALFWAVARAAVKRESGWLLSAGWAGHALWDGALHLAGPVTGTEGYAALCVGFDGVVALWILARAGRVGRMDRGIVGVRHG